MILHLIRHGHTQGSEQRLYYGKTDLPVSETGLHALAQKRKSGGYPSLDGLAVYTTPLQRTEHTLQALYGDVTHHILPGFGEIDFGIFEMGSYGQWKDDPQYQAWIGGDFMVNVPPQGESFAQFTVRILQQLETLVAKNQSALVIGHAGTISVIMNHFFPQENKHHYAWAPEPGEGYTLTLGDAPSYQPLPTPYWAGKHYAFFQNSQCEYFPCHKTDKPEGFNCLFCYCPLFALGDNCGGHFTYTDGGDKNCTHCLIPHQRENYGKILEKYPLLKELTKKNTP